MRSKRKYNWALQCVHEGFRFSARYGSKAEATQDALKVAGPAHEKVFKPVRVKGEG